MRQVARAFDPIELLRLALDGQPQLSFRQKAIAQKGRTRNSFSSSFHDFKHRLGATEAPVQQMIAGVIVKAINGDAIHGEARSVEANSTLKIPAGGVNIVI